MAQRETGIDPDTIIRKFYNPDSDRYKILISHSRQVADKALDVADRVRHLDPDRQFIFEAAMLHDIGICQTNSPKFDCHGEASYVFHGVLGRQMLDSLGLGRHGLVAERHPGCGITSEEIRSRNIDLPQRDMVPKTIEEIIICYADKFYSKSTHGRDREKTIDEICNSLKIFGKRHIDTFLSWVDFFGETDYGR